MLLKDSERWNINSILPLAVAEKIACRSFYAVDVHKPAFHRPTPMGNHDQCEFQLPRGSYLAREHQCGYIIWTW
jgi:hypothetical protein